MAPMFGSHLSIAGSMVNALHEAETLGFDTVQVFTKNQQQWAAKPLDPGMVKEWSFELARLGWNGQRGTPGRTVSHASYLINLASYNDELWRKSVDLMRDEIERCETLGIGLLVHHPGSYVGWDLERGLARIADAYAELFKSTAGYTTVSCLEDTAGAGSTIGGSLEELSSLRGMIVERTAQPDRIGFCLDTCHLHAFGYDLSTRAGAKATLERFVELEKSGGGLAHVRAIHLNDSKGATGSKLDRHTHIGEGTIGGGPGGVAQGVAQGVACSGFAEFVNRPEFLGIPKILETPKETNSDGTNWDTINLRTLKAVLDDSEASAVDTPFVQTRSLSLSPTKAPTKAPTKPLAKALAKPTKSLKTNTNTNTKLSMKTSIKTSPKPRPSTRKNER